MNKSIISITVFLLIGLSGTTFADDNIPDRKMRLALGFEHWYSDSFRTADQGTNFSLGMNYRLPLRWFEFALRYEWATIKADPSQSDFLEFNGKHIYFMTVGFSAVRDFNVESHTVTLSALLGILGVTVDGHDASAGYTAGYNVDWLFDGRTGMFLDVRYKGYELQRLDGSRTDLQSDVSVVVGVATRL